MHFKSLTNMNLIFDLSVQEFPTVFKRGLNSIWERKKEGYVGIPQWGRTAKNRDVSTGPLARPLLVRSHRSLVRLLRTACFARALRCALCCARSLTLLIPLLVGK